MDKSGIVNVNVRKYIKSTGDDGFKALYLEAGSAENWTTVAGLKGKLDSRHGL